MPTPRQNPGYTKRCFGLSSKNCVDLWIACLVFTKGFSSTCMGFILGCIYCKDPWIPLVMYHQDLYKERMVQDVWQWRLCPGENCSFWVWQRQRLTIGTVAEWSKWAKCPRKLDRLLLSRLLMCQNVTAVANYDLHHHHHHPFQDADYNEIWGAYIWLMDTLW